MNKQHGASKGQRSAPPAGRHRVRSDIPFYAAMLALCGLYALLLGAMLVADATFTSPEKLWESLKSEELRYSLWLSLITCTISAILSVWVAVPIGYLMSRHRFFGKILIDSLFDIPIVLPPLVIGLSLLILFQTGPGRALESLFTGGLEALGITGVKGITYEVPAVILAQFAVACAFAVRTMRVTFEQIDPRAEEVALTLGCSRGQAFLAIGLPQARRGMVAAFTLAWARALGEFGPILVFAGATRMKTEVLSTSIFLELSVGDLPAAVAVSINMVTVAMAVLIIARVLGLREAVL